MTQLIEADTEARKELELLQKDSTDLANQARWWATLWGIPTTAILFGGANQTTIFGMPVAVPEGGLKSIATAMWLAASLPLLASIWPRTISRMPDDLRVTTNRQVETLTARVNRAEKQVIGMKWAIKSALLLMWFAFVLAAQSVLGSSGWLVSALLVELLVYAGVAFFLVALFELGPNPSRSPLGMLVQSVWHRWPHLAKVRRHREPQFDSHDAVVVANETEMI
jgi:hypothetical protein